MSEFVLEIKNLEFAYPNKKTILQIDNFYLKTTEKVFIYGSSGCGKSTFLSIIAGILNAQKGSVKFLGHEFVNSPSSLRDKVRGEKMGYIFQMFNLIPYLTVLENILLPTNLNKPRLRRFLSGPDPLEKAFSLCQKFKIDSLLNHKVTEISIGQQQRVAAARALFGNPKLIIADEPTSAMDAEVQEIFLDNLFSQCEKQKAALLFVSHDRRLAKTFHRQISLPEINSIK